MSIEHLKTYFNFANISRLSPDFLWLLKMVTPSNDGKEKDHPSKPKILRNHTESLLYLPEDPQVHYRDSTNCPIFQRVVGFPKYRNEASKNLHRKKQTMYQLYLCVYLIRILIFPVPDTFHPFFSGQCATSPTSCRYCYPVKQ